MWKWQWYQQQKYRTPLIPLATTTAYQAKVSYKKPESSNNRHPTKGWYSKSIMELVKKTYDIDISYATATRILHHAFH